MVTSEQQALPEIVTVEQWRKARAELLLQEKQLTKMHDKVSAERRRLPMVKVTKHYQFADANGQESLLELFAGRRQLIVYHFMFAADWQAGCPGCSWVVDAMSHPAHLLARDTALVLISKAEPEKLANYQQRMAWALPWYSSAGTPFNEDFGATVDGAEQHGVSVFLRDGEDIYHCYHSGDRGVEQLGSHWSYLDLTPFGRQEEWEDSPSGWPQTPAYGWQKRHDEY